MTIAPHSLTLLFAVMVPFAMLGCNQATPPAPVAPTPPVVVDHAHAEGDDHAHAESEDHAHAEGGDHAHAEGDAHAHAETFPAALEQVVALKKQIQTAFEAGTPDDAHDAMHDVFHVLEDLTGLAEKATEDPAKITAVNEAAENLLDAYEKLDEGMHGGDQVEYSAVADAIDSAISKLNDFAKE